MPGWSRAQKTIGFPTLDTLIEVWCVIFGCGALQIPNLSQRSWALCWGAMRQVLSLSLSVSKGSSDEYIYCMDDHSGPWIIYSVDGRNPKQPPGMYRHKNKRRPFQAIQSYWIVVINTVDGRNPAPVESIGSFSHYVQGFIHSRWLFGISSINRINYYYSTRRYCLEGPGALFLWPNSRTSWNEESSPTKCCVNIGFQQLEMLWTFKGVPGCAFLTSFWWRKDQAIFLQYVLGSKLTIVSQ